MEVADRQQVGLAFGEPRACRSALTLRAVAVATAVERGTPMPAIFAGLDVTAHRSGAAMLNRRHDLKLVKAQMSGMRGPIGGPRMPENVGDLNGGPHPAS